MKVNKTSNYSAYIQGKDRSHILSVDTDLRNLATALTGRVRFGTGEDGSRGENMSGEFKVFTTSATPDAENTVAHGVGAVPVGYIVLKQDKAGSLYIGSTSWTKANVYLKCNVASVTFTIFLLK